MTHLTIKNIGPIKEIDIDLRRFNVFIGPQSSGKSTIAKIISYCRWLEKDCVRHQRISHLDSDFIKKSLVDYHNLSHYLNGDSHFLYRSEVLEIEMNAGSLGLKKGKAFLKSKISKNAYIPSERNLISIPGIFETKMPDNYILSFLSDWKRIREKYKGENASDVMPTGDSYFFEEDSKVDMLHIKSGIDIPLSSASSGLQSVTPLVVYINYITDWIYTHDEEMSADEKDALWEAAVANVMDESANRKGLGTLDIIERKDTPETIKESFKVILAHLRDLEKEKVDDDLFKGIIARREAFSRPAFSNLVIEEPEQNLFPQTQRKLVEYIFGKLNKDRDTLVLTTHSPFVLYSLNNLLLGYLAAREDEENIEDVTHIPIMSFVNPAEMSVWELRDGYIENIEGKRNVTIQDEKGLIRNNYFDRIMGNVMADFKNLLGIL